jgi:hypothetical protein
MSHRMRRACFAAVVFVVLFGVGEFARWISESLGASGWWAIDLELVLAAGRRLAAGEPIYADARFLYPPVAAVIGSALAGFDPRLVSGGYLVLKLVIATFGVAALTPTWSVPARVLACAGLVASLPFLHDVMLGNANVLLVAAIGVAAYGRPTVMAGIALGALTAVFAKPLVVPVMVWLLVYRRSVFGGAVLAGLAVTLAGLVMTGISAYVDWVQALVAGGQYAAPFAGNHGVTAIAPSLWPPVAALTAVGLVVVLVRRGPGVGLVWAVTSGILLAPYAGTYAALPIVLALPVIGSRAPWMALAIVAVSPIATTHPLPFYAAAILVAALALSDEPDTRWRPGAVPTVRTRERGQQRGELVDQEPGVGHHGQDHGGRPAPTGRRQAQRGDGGSQGAQDPQERIDHP